MNKVIDNIVIRKLSNDLTTYVREIDIAGDFVSLGLSINKGSLNESDKERGTAHFLEHMIIDCSAMNDISFNRVYRRAYTDFFETTYLFNCHRKNLDFCLSLIAKLIKGDFLQECEMDRVKEHVLNEYVEVANSTDYKIMQALCENNMRYCAHYPIGTRKSIEDMTYHKIISFFDRCYSAQNMALVIVGDIQEVAALELIRNKFSNVRKFEERKEINENYNFVHGKYSILNSKRNGIEVYFCIENVISLSDYKIVENELMNIIALDVIEKALARFLINITIECKIRKFSRLNSFLTILVQGDVSEIEIEWLLKKGLFVNICSVISDVISEYQAFILHGEGFGINLDSARSECIRNFVYSDNLICYDTGYIIEKEVLNKITCNDLHERIVEWVVNNDYKLIFFK